MASAARFSAVGLAVVAIVCVDTRPSQALTEKAEPSHADKHCGLYVGKAPNVNMWELQPATERKTTRELIISIVRSRQFYRACNENGLTVVVKMAGRRKIETVYFVKDRGLGISPATRWDRPLLRR